MYRFGPFRLDVQREQLLLGDRMLPVNRKAVQLLGVLVERRGSVVTKEELLKRVWPDRKATPNNLSQHIFMLRSVLEDGAPGEPCVLTVPRVGYRFVAPVERADASSADRILAEQYCINAAELHAMYTPGSTTSAIELYERALTHDERSVEALSGLAACHLLRADEGFAPASPAIAQAEAYAERALRTDPRNARALVVLAGAWMKGSFRWEDAETLLLDAFRAHPRDEAVHAALVEQYIVRRDIPQARQALENARTLSSPQAYPRLPLLRGWLHYYTGWFDTALAHFELLLDTYPDYAAAHLAHAKTLIAQREHDRASAALERLLEIRFDPLRAGQPIPRREAMALQVMIGARTAQDFRERWKDRTPSFYCNTLIALAAGDTHEAITSIRRSIEAREPLALFAAGDPLMRPLHPYVKYS